MIFKWRCVLLCFVHLCEHLCVSMSFFDWQCELLNSLRTGPRIQLLLHLSFCSCLHRSFFCVGISESIPRFRFFHAMNIQPKKITYVNTYVNIVYILCNIDCVAAFQSLQSFLWVQGLEPEALVNPTTTTCDPGLDPPEMAGAPRAMLRVTTPRCVVFSVCPTNRHNATQHSSRLVICFFSIAFKFYIMISCITFFAMSFRVFLDASQSPYWTQPSTHLHSLSKFDAHLWASGKSSVTLRLVGFNDSWAPLPCTL